jgi:hypothetical protein
VVLGGSDRVLRPRAPTLQFQAPIRCLRHPGIHLNAAAVPQRPLAQSRKRIASSGFRTIKLINLQRYSARFSAGTPRVPAEVMAAKPNRPSSPDFKPSSSGASSEAETKYPLSPVAPATPASLSLATSSIASEFGSPSPSPLVTELAADATRESSATLSSSSSSLSPPPYSVPVIRKVVSARPPSLAVLSIIT